MSKILEVIMFKKLEQHLESNNILATEQFGFRKVVSIKNAIFTLTVNILTSLNHCQQVGGIFCNLTKAFDCVSHTVPLNKLHYYGMRGKRLKVALLGLLRHCSLIDRLYPRPQ
jgi:hypothetical protein